MSGGEYTMRVQVNSNMSLSGIFKIMMLSCRPLAAILGLTNEANNTSNLLSHILLVYKYYLDILRDKNTNNIDILIDNLMEIKKKEKRISFISNKKTETLKTGHYR